jgi:hypothetical protein
LGGVARIAYTLNVMSKQDAKRCNIAEKDKSKYLLLEQAKANMSAPGEHRMYFERVGVTIGQGEGESVGVLSTRTFIERSIEKVVKENTKPFILAIEGAIKDTPKTFAEIADILIKGGGEYENEKSMNLSKKISRLVGEDKFTGINGVLTIRTRAGDERGTKEVSFKPNENIQVDDII